RRSALAVAEALIPGSRRIPGADERLVEHAEELLSELSPALVKPWAAALRLLDLAALPRAGRALSSPPGPDPERVLRSLEHDPALRLPLSLISLLYKLVHFDDEAVYAALGGTRNVVRTLEQPRWLSQVHRGDAWEDGDLECDVVVVGTGAGGGVVGCELAE